MRKLSNPKNLSGEKIELIKKFWKEYGSFYSKETQYNFRHNLLSAFLRKDLPLIYLSIYSYLGILETNRDVYKWFYEYLKNYHTDFLSSNILEVGCGSIPALCKIISDNLEESGYIIGIDERLFVRDINNGTLKKESFSYDTDISKIDTIIGFAPCEATPIALRKACREKKELTIAVCECLHPDGKAIYQNYDKLLNHYYRLVKTEMSSEFVFDINKIPQEYETDFPILSLRKK